MYRKGLIRLLLAGTAVAGGTGVAQAQTSGTGAGTVISNQAQASYTVNGTPQTANSNIATFVVDRKVNLTLVVDQAANTQVNLGQQAAVTTFRLTNLTNGTQDFILDPDQTGLSVGVLPGADNFDVTALRAFVDSNNNGTYEPAIDTRNYVDELAADTSIAVFVVGDIPNTSSANLAFVSMHAIIAAGGTTGTLGAQLVPTPLNTVNQDAEIDIVFTDGDSDAAFAGDIARNGQARAYAAYEVGARNVDLTITKSSRVVADGFDLINPKALPGATVEYCLIVRNASLLVPASGVTLTDIVPVNTTYVPGTIQIGALNGATSCVVPGLPEDDDADDAGELDPYSGSYAAGNRTVTATIPTLLGGTSVAASFRVTIN